MSSITPSSIPIFTKEKHLTGQKTWVAFKREVLLQVGAKGMVGYLDGEIARPKLPKTTKQLSTESPNSADTDSAKATPAPTPSTTPAQPAVVLPTQFFSTTPSVEEWDARDRWVASVIISNTVDPIGIGIDET
ncbi:hypothetical protein PQX77_020243 [Marasmius sp. AFHP31]|nr:hypothetical protein PQX77_020243 [Marasmius sp. AFHP31]